MSAWIYVATTLVLTVYGQLVVKWQVGRAGPMPESVAGRLEFLGRLVLNPWVISVLLAAFVAALAWMAAMSKLELSRAYPWMSLSFALVLVFSAVLFGESITVWKLAGVGLILLGVVVGSQGLTQ
jgi:multidrug transporter EmrE-like cation transporter